MQTSCGNTRETPIKSDPPGQTLRCNTSMDINQQFSAPFGQQIHSLNAPQRNCNILPGNCPENSLIVREALRMNLPHHLVLRNVQRRIQTLGSNYTDMKDLVSDLFEPNSRSCSVGNQEVPMETNQLEEALMMNTQVVKKALQMGVPPHLIKPKVRAKILSNKVGYADVTELLKDLSIK